VILYQLQGSLRRFWLLNCLRIPVLTLALNHLWFSALQLEATPAGTPFNMTSEVAQLIRNGQQAMYNGDFQNADRETDTLIRLYPDHPAGYMYRAISIWWRCLGDKSNKSLQEDFLKYAEKGIACGEALVAKNPKDFFAQMFLAGIYGNQARFFLTITHSRLAAIRSGMKGDKYNRNALALRPDSIDCLIGTASYYYAPEALPPLLKQFASALGVRGDKSRSLKELELAAVKGEFVQTEAKLILLGIYYNEKWFEKYDPLMRSLIDQFPANRILYNWYASYLIEQKHAPDGIRYFSSLLSKAAENHQFVISKGYALLEKGRLELELGAGKEAYASFSQGIETTPRDPVFLAQAHLYRGFAADLLKKRSSALEDYQSVLSLPNVDETRKIASRFTKTPYQGKI
jgi:hypothetical protein